MSVLDVRSHGQFDSKGIDFGQLWNDIKSLFGYSEPEEPVANVEPEEPVANVESVAPSVLTKPNIIRADGIIGNDAHRVGTEDDDLFTSDWGDSHIWVFQGQDTLNVNVARPGHKIVHDFENGLTTKVICKGEVLAKVEDSTFFQYQDENDQMSQEGTSIQFGQDLLVEYLRAEPKEVVGTVDATGSCNLQWDLG